MMKKYKRVFKILGISAVGLVLLGGCTNNNPKKEETNDQTQQTSEKKNDEKIVALGQELNLGIYTYVITNSHVTETFEGENNETFTAKNGTFLILDVSITNNMKSKTGTSTASHAKLIDGTKTFEPAESKIQSAANIDRLATDKRSELSPGLLQYMYLEGGETQNGKLVFDVPKDVAVSSNAMVQFGVGGDYLGLIKVH